MDIVPYLSFDGNCAEAFKLYEAALGGKITMMMTFGEMPSEYAGDPKDSDRIMHATLFAGSARLMGSDSPCNAGKKAQGFCVSLNIADVAEAERVYAALSEGGEIQMPLQPTFWAARFAMFTDRFGTPWMINAGETAGA